jgi:hypothetical protein
METRPRVKEMIYYSRRVSARVSDFEGNLQPRRLINNRVGESGIQRSLDVVALYQWPLTYLNYFRDRTNDLENKVETLAHRTSGFVHGTNYLCIKLTNMVLRPTTMDKEPVAYILVDRKIPTSLFHYCTLQHVMLRKTSNSTWLYE